MTTSPRILVLRGAADARPLMDALAALDTEPVHLPLLAFEPCDEQLRFPESGWLVLTSPRAADRLRDFDPAAAETVRIAAVGARTAQVAHDYGFQVAVTGETGAQQLSMTLLAQVEGQSVHWWRGDRALPHVRAVFRHLGDRFHEACVYRTRFETPSQDAVAGALQDLDGAIFASPSSIEALRKIAPKSFWIRALREMPVLAGGETTAEALFRAGFQRVGLATGPGPEQLAGGIKRHLEASPGEVISVASATLRSEDIMARAKVLMPGGVSSPVRAYKGVGGTPPVIARGEGAYLFDEDGHRYVDMVMSFGPHLFGHGHKAIREALHAAVDSGTSFGAPTELEVELASAITGRIPSVDMVRFVNSGTEATMSAVRLARAVTGRDRILKFDGCYHGHGDSFLVRAGSGALTHGAPDSPGVPSALAELTLVADYNDLDSVARLMGQHPGEVAAVIVEPVAGNIGCVLPADGFLGGLRRLCDRHGALLIFDEVMTGFRVARGGYQDLCQVRPDLTTLGKVIGGGLPVGAYGGGSDLMEQLSPSGPVYQAGTLSGNPLAMAAGLASLRLADQESTYERLEDAGAHLQAGIEHILEDLEISGVVQRQGSMLCLYFHEGPVTTLGQVMSSDRERFQAFFHRMRAGGVLLPPSPFEAWFVSAAHTPEVLDEVLLAVREALVSSGVS